MKTGNPLKLPRLPIPPLEDTLRRFLKSLTPIAGENSPEFEAARAVTDKFLRGGGQELQRMLVLRDQTDAAAGGYPYSYIERFWDDMYLCGRWALPINSNPFLALAPGPPGSIPPNADQQTTGAARFLSSFLKFCSSVRGGEFPLDQPPGCVAPYPLQLGTGRVPRTRRDVLTSHPDSRHLVVFCANRPFRLEVLDQAGRRLPEEILARRLMEIRAAAKAPAPPTLGSSGGATSGNSDLFVGYLTAADRDEWAAARAELEKDPANRSALEEIDSALLVVALDDEGTDGAYAKEAQLFLHGRNGRNRWFDKHQLIVLSDGRMAVNFEHSYSDGVAWCRMLADVWRDMHSGALASPPRFGTPLPQTATCGAAALAPPHEIGFHLSGGGGAAVEKAREDFAKACGGCGVAVLDFEAFGKGEVKKWGVSPDAAAQMAFQLAFRTVHGGKVAPTYESCSTRGFHHGRTENIRACTAEGAAFHAAMLNPSASAGDRKAALAAAAAAHVSLAKEAQRGLGVDRHLAGLRDIRANSAPELGSAFFANPLMGKSATWLLSTSNLSHPFLTQFGFGAVTGGGYGVGYMIHEGAVRATVSNFHGGETDAGALVHAMEKALVDMRDLHRPHQ